MAIDAYTAEFYGYIVASDSLGDTFVVPYQLTFEDIQEPLNATSVDILSAKELSVFLCSKETSTIEEMSRELMNWQIPPRVNQSQ